MTPELLTRLRCTSVHTPPCYGVLVHRKMQALLHGIPPNHAAQTSDVALMGPTHRGDAISGILEDMRRGEVLAQAIGVRLVF